MKTKMLVLLLSVCMVFAIVPSTANAEGTDLEAETSNEMTADLVINTKEDLIAFRDAVNAGDNFAGKVVKLAADIDLAGEEWKPINSFSGEFDGQNYTIKNFDIDATANNGGFFNSIEAGDGERVHDLVISDVTATVGNARFGTLANSLKGIVNRVTIKNVTVTTTHAAAWVGGFAAFLSWPWCNDCTVENLTVNAENGADLIAGFSPILQKNSNMVFDNLDVTGMKVTVTDNTSDGCGVAGFVTQTQRGWENPSVKNCDISGFDVIATGNVDVAGFITWPGAHTIATNCTTEGKIDATGVTGASNFAGGFFGNLGWNADLGQKGHIVTGCTANVDIKTSVAPAGGFVGSATNSNNASMYAEFTNCVAKGDITSTGTAPVGGFAGNADRGVYNNCSATGTVTGADGTTGGFIGYIKDTNPSYDSRYPKGTREYNVDYITISNCYGSVDPLVGAIADTKSKEEVTIIDETAPIIELSYSNNGQPTNQPVIVTVTANEPIQSPGAGWEEVEGSNGTQWTKAYADNYEYSYFKCKDLEGNLSASVVFKVEGIDKEAPIIELSYSNNGGPTNQDVVVTVTANEPIQKLGAGWEEVEGSNGTQWTKVYSENYEYRYFKGTDLAGNKSASVWFKVEGIDKETPEYVLIFETNEDGSVTAVITVTEKVTISGEGWEATDVENQFKKVYTENTEEVVTLKDTAGNTTDITVTIDSIIEDPCAKCHGKVCVVNAKPATCTKPGYTGDKVCKVCGETICIGNEIPALGHYYVDLDCTAVKPTCTEAGKEADCICILCGDVIKGVEVPATDHSYVVDETTKVEPTCTEVGKEADQVCENCGSVIQGAEIPATGHFYVVDETTKVEPTCTEAGKEADQICENCGDVIQGAEIPALEHSEDCGHEDMDKNDSEDGDDGVVGDDTDDNLADNVVVDDDADDSEEESKKVVVVKGEDDTDSVPKTGDSANIMGYLFIMAAALAVAVIAVIKKRNA